ncbi:hypothetical protein CTA2_6364 [Colletotrichum tanaceti]|uniref:Uncharacterized protein n=1 Tax=Colletotrichum tanaceti TaxID=1306861 RepID=A0A4U6X1X7_9PEZI|nr:hypothetical protein CTA2_6364 [Colletotrichum tanaceti]TKW49004.1 hypothetical protein CTA1_8591 [Colletotrichum tanaceti]
MGTRVSPWKGLCRGLLHLAILALLVNTCQSRGKDHKKRDGSSRELSSLATTDGTTLSMSASESRQGRVVTSIVTTYILVTLPCGASDPPSSINLQTHASSTSANASATRGPGSSLTRPWNTTIVNPGVSSSLGNWNSTKVNSQTSMVISNGTTTAVNNGVSMLPSSNEGVSTGKLGQSPALSSVTNSSANPPVSHSVTSSFSKPILSKQPVKSENTSFNASLSSPMTASTQGGQSSRSAGSSTSTLQMSLSEGGTAQPSRVTTASPGQASTPSAGAQPVESSSSSSTKATGKDPSLPSSSSSGEGARSSTGLSQTSPSGTGSEVIPTSSMPRSVPSGDSTQQHSTKAPWASSSASSNGNKSKTTEATGNDDGSKTSTKKGHDNDNNTSDDDHSTKASPGSTQDSGISSTSAVSSAGKSASPSATAEPGSRLSSETGGPESTSSEDQDYATVFMTATIDPPPGIDPKTTVTWTSTEVTKTTTRDGSAWPTIFPVWFCGGGQLLCPPKCLIPFLFCGGIDSPGPLGFPWAKPPPRKPRGKPRKVRPDDPTDPEDPEDDPEPSETPSPTSSSSEASCTASTTLSPHCDQHCFVSPVTTTGSSTSFTTSCNAATCQPTVVCSRTLDTTTTTTFTTHSSTPTPVEHFCGDRESPCLDCGGKEKPAAGAKPKALVARQHGFIPWNPAPDPELLNGPQGLTRPETWPQGPQSWWDRMWKYVYHYCDGLTAPRLTLDGERLEMGYSTMHADAFGDQGLAGATGPFWGCSGIVIVTKRGIYTSHVWEIPNFHKGTHKPTALDWAEEFEEGILRFLKRGSGDRVGGYVGVDQLERSTDIFANKGEDTLAVILHVPSSMTFSGSSQIPPNYGDFDPRHEALVDRWADFIAGDLGFPRDKIRKNIYVKGPSYWPAYVEERRPLNPMDMYTPPYGLLHWQYHPAHVVETLADGTEVRKPTIRVWYEKFLIFEESWCLPGTVATRDEKARGGGSCPMPSAPPAAQSSLAASGGGSGSASGSASSGGGNTNQLSPNTSAATRNSSSTAFVPPAAFPSNSTRTSGASTINTTGLPATGPSSSSSKAKATAWVTATAQVTATSWGDPDPTPSAATNKPSYVSGGPVISRVPASEAEKKPLPTPSHGPSRRVVRISQDMSFGADKKTNHTAVITMYEITADTAGGGGTRETILVSQRDGGGGGSPVDLPSTIAVEDQDGGRLEVNFVTAPQQIELESRRRGRVLRWTMVNIEDQQNPDKPYCDVRSVTPGEGVLKRSVECFYNT